MKKVKKTLIVVVLIFAGIWILYLSVYAVPKASASEEICIAIQENNLQKVQSIVEECPESVNALPTTAPWWIRLITEQPSVAYPLQSSCRWGRVDITEYLLEHGADSNLVSKGTHGSESALSRAVMRNDEASIIIVEMLLEAGADKSYIDEHGKTAYDYAIENENFELAEMVKP